MRVLHVIWSLAGGGAERLLLEMARPSGSAVTYSVQPIADGGELTEAFRDAGVDVLPSVRRGRQVGPRGILRLAHLAREFDVIHTHLWAGDFWGRIVGSLAGVPVVTTEHNSRPDSAVRGGLSRLMEPLSNRIVYVSSAARGHVTRSSSRAERHVVIPNGVVVSRFVPAPLPDVSHRRVLFVGRLVRQKGPDLLLSALEMLRHDGVQARLVGDGPLRGSIEQHPMVRQGTVEVMGWVDDIRPHLEWSTFVVMPSRWEGFGLVAVEAMAAGRAVVHTQVDSLPGIVDDAGYAVEPDNPAALARLLDAVLADRAELERKTRRAPERASRYSLDRMVCAYEALYRDVVRTHRGEVS